MFIYTDICRLVKAKTMFFVFVVSLLFVFKTSAQDSLRQQFNVEIKKTLSQRPSEFNALETTFRKHKRDSIKMKHLLVESKDSKYIEGESYALNALGIINRNLSHYTRAIDYHKQSEKLAIIAGNLELMVISLNMQGVVYRRMDFVRSALDYHAQALNLANSIAVPSENIERSIAVSQNSMGNIYLTLKQYDLALEQFNKSIDLEKRLNNKLGLAINYQNIGFAKEAKGFLYEALIDYETSLSYNNEINSEIGRVVCYNSIVQVYIKQKKFDEALELSKHTLAKALEVGDQYYISTSYMNLGWAHCGLNNILQAEENLNLAMGVSKKYGLKSSEIDVHKRLAEFFSKTGNHQTAFEEFKEADSLEKSIANERNLNYINDLVLKYESESKNKAIQNLADENLFVKTRLEKNQLAMLLGLLAFILIVVVFTVYDRHKQLKQEKKILTLEQDMLRIQMNPHFIFNSLNSIKLYIINNEKENAVYYLNKFSKLIRKILMVSKEKDIPLSDELETMDLYMNIENIRFSNQIDFKILIDEDVNASNIKVPSLILQPFLENALWHGLASKKEDKQITLKVKRGSKNHVIISITDNGVGRKASKKINKQKTLNRTSVGIALTKDRLENFSKRYTKMYSMEIEDLYDEKGNASGTKIILDIPINLTSKEKV